LVHLYDHYKDKGIVFLPLSLDGERQVHDKVIPFLKKEKFTGPAAAIADVDPDKFLALVDQTWDGGTPHSYVLDRNGGVRQTISGAVDPPQLEALVKKLLAEKPGAGKPAPTSHPKGFLAEP
jgi:hypothetical protein